MSKSVENDTKVVDLGSFRKKKQMEKELGKGRTPLISSHLKKKVTDPSTLGNTSDFGDRLTRIRSSLDRINSLMSDLRKIADRNPEAKPKNRKSDKGSPKK